MSTSFKVVSFEILGGFTYLSIADTFSQYAIIIIFSRYPRIYPRGTSFPFLAYLPLIRKKMYAYDITILCVAIFKF